MVVIGVFIQIEGRLIMTARDKPRADLTRLIQIEKMWKKKFSFGCFMFVAIAFATCGWHGCWRDPRWCVEVEVIEDIYLLCVCGVAVAMVMIGESARWQGGPLLENFGHRGALELILQSLMYRSRGALHLNVLYRCPVYCTIEWSYLWSRGIEGSPYSL